MRMTDSSQRQALAGMSTKEGTAFCSSFAPFFFFEGSFPSTHVGGASAAPCPPGRSRVSASLQVPWGQPHTMVAPFPFPRPQLMSQSLG